MLRPPTDSLRPSARNRSDRLVLDGGPISIELAARIARAPHAHAVSLGPAARAAITRSRNAVEACLSDGEAHYGINTGFGSLSRTRVAPDHLRELQRNLIRSHDAGIGTPLPPEVVRCMMLLLAASLSRGLSGVRAEVVELLVAMLNQGVTPVVPSIGSVGASGDLAPLAAIGMVMIGEGRASATLAGDATPRISKGADALRAAGLRPIVLEAKEGLAIINGTHLMASLGTLLCDELATLFDAALAACAMSIDASRASHTFLDPRVHRARNQPGQALVAERLRGMLGKSRIAQSHRENDPRVQDPYCLRCAPQVLGAVWDCLGYVKQAVHNELGAVTDNPLVFAGVPAKSARSKGTKPRSASTEHVAILSAGNFHGMPLAIPLDACAIALSHLAGIAERRIFWMLCAFDPESHLPPYLAKSAGLSSGLMIAQYTAAACCNEIVNIANPASVANIVTSAGIEDYNSFGPRAGMKARRALDLARSVVAIELLCAAEGLEYHRPLTSGAGVERAYQAVRVCVPRLEGDRPPGPDIQRIAHAIATGSFAV